MTVKELERNFVLAFGKSTSVWYKAKATKNNQKFLDLVNEAVLKFKADDERNEMFLKLKTKAMRGPWVSETKFMNWYGKLARGNKVKFPKADVFSLK